MLSYTGKETIIILSILTSLSTLFVTLRLTKLKAARNFGVDDGLLVFALFMIYLQDAGAFLLAIKGGEGEPFASLTPEQVKWLLLMFYFPELGYTILIATIKSSILISYRRIFGHITWCSYAIYTLGILVGVWFLGVFFSVMFQCTPVDKAWYPTKEGHCIDLIAFLWGNSVSNNILDWLILFLPIVPVWRLHMEPVQKALVLGSFLLGSLACIASLVRAILTGTVNTTDLSKSVFKASVWTYIEPNLGVIAACLPYLAKVLGQRIRKMLLSLSTLNFTSLIGHESRKNAQDTNATGASGTPRDYRAYEMTDGDDHKSSNSATRVTAEHESIESLV